MDRGNECAYNSSPRLSNHVRCYSATQHALPAVRCAVSSQALNVVQVVPHSSKSLNRLN